MWKNVTALEEENKRLRKELEEWVEKALELSKRLHNLAKKMNGSTETNTTC